MAEGHFISTSSSSSFSNSLADSTASSASSDDMTDSGNSSWGILPPPMPHGPLFYMKSLSDSLPARKRGLSNFFTGKSQSFTCVGDVKCVEELAKPEKKLMTSHSWESTIKSSYDNETFRSSILLAGSAESMKTPCKSPYGSRLGKKNGRLIPTKSHKLPLSRPKQITRTHGQQTIY